MDQHRGTSGMDQHRELAAMGITPSLPPRPASVMEQRAHPVLSQCIKTLVGHTKAVYGLAMAPDGEHIISAGGDRLIHVWHTSSGDLVNTLTGHGARVHG